MVIITAVWEAVQREAASRAIGVIGIGPRLMDVIFCTARVTHRDDPMTEATFTFRVDEALKAEFTTAAKSRDRTGAQLLRDFMREFVQRQRDAAAHDAWFRQQVQIGIDEVNAGKFFTSEEVEAEAAAWRDETRRKHGIA